MLWWRKMQFGENDSKDNINNNIGSANAEKYKGDKGIYEGTLDVEDLLPIIRKI